MKLEYGPPGAVGVKHLQYLSADEPDYASRLPRPSVMLSMGSIALWFLGYKKASTATIVAAVATSLAGR